MESQFYRKLNSLQSFLLKVNRPTLYGFYKDFVSFSKSAEFDQALPVTARNTRTHSFRHSGNLGDIIYALPVLATLKGDRKINELYLRINQPSQLDNHSMGQFMLTEKTVEWMKPLLSELSYIDKTDVFNDQSIDFDLDLFRKMPIKFSSGDISRWYFYIFNVYYDLSQPWIRVIPNDYFSHSVVLSRTERYNNPVIDYSFLKEYPSVYFVGMESEFLKMKKVIPNLDWAKVNNALELAQVIAGAKVFIGNQSFPYALAEAMKTTRILELCVYCPNVVVHGERGYDFYFQKNLESLVSRLTGRIQ
jgi:hypothetical protein